MWTFFRAAACLWTTRAADVAAALLRATLTATNAEQHDEQEGAKDDQQDCEPVWNRSEDSTSPTVELKNTVLLKKLYG